MQGKIVCTEVDLYNMGVATARAHDKVNTCTDISMFSPAATPPRDPLHIPLMEPKIFNRQQRPIRSIDKIESYTRHTP